ncbi:MAG TPA: protein translocase subunit SecF [Candidatus Avacidaminococcus intestinavium]|uniref:Protein-export membrane protein SecF n=1 Tax=Candidatus Avacidaminococcus intestinavium TaxID=2840684 RepID=A0A9D1MRL2_9FIRM|nr:protein translocase subunit SecF [Candidatus Avacidaminococcus intestinavium]
MKHSITKNFKAYVLVTLVLLLIGIGSMIAQGFNLGIDFEGGNIIDVSFEHPITVAEVRTVMEKHDLSNSIIQLDITDDASSSKGVIIRTGIIDDTTRQSILNDLQNTIGNYDVNRIEQVGATVGSELVRQAVIAIAISWLLMIIYITVRFELRFAIAAILALMIDVLMVISWFAFFHLEIDSSFVAALLTVIGFSVNGTIVLYDRIRENLKSHRPNESLTELVDNSIMQCLTRTLYTNFMVLFTVASIMIFGGETIRNFAFAMFVGFSSGLYTSIFLAGPMWKILKEKY